jgi:hypothetical protein
MKYVDPTGNEPSNFCYNLFCSTFPTYNSTYLNWTTGRMETSSINYGAFLLNDKASITAIRIGGGIFVGAVTMGVGLGFYEALLADGGYMVGTRMWMDYAENKTIDTNTLKNSIMDLGITFTLGTGLKGVGGIISENSSYLAKFFKTQTEPKWNAFPDQISHFNKIFGGFQYFEDNKLFYVFLHSMNSLDKSKPFMDLFKTIEMQARKMGAKTLKLHLNAIWEENVKMTNPTIWKRYGYSIEKSYIENTGGQKLYYLDVIKKLK